MADQTAFISEAKDRYQSSKTAWTDRRREALLDQQFCNVIGGQWDAAVRNARVNGDPPRPALEFNELHTYVQRIVNQGRQERPQIKVGLGDEGDPETADVLEGKVRHIQYASQADVAFDGALEAAATGGFGWYRITREYTDGITGSRPHLEPRIRRILDPMTVFPDPMAQEPDLSDMRWCIVRQRYRREGEYKREFGIDPTPFDEENSDNDWGDNEEFVWVAEYWWTKIKSQRKLFLADGREGFEGDVGDYAEEDILNERPVEDRQVWCSIIDGSREIERTYWPGDWIPLIPVLGREVVVEGKRILISAIRFARDPQKLKNVTLTDAAEQLGSANRSTWMGAIGSFKDGKWRNGKRNLYLEYTPVTDPVSGTIMPPPQFNTYEPPIQGLLAMTLQMKDAIKNSAGYVDDVLRPSASDISGVAVQRRQGQSDLTNFHFEDNLVRSQWHCGRQLIDLIMKDTDTPRPMQTQREDKKINTVPVTMEMSDGSVPQVPGFEGQRHYRMDQGEYNVVISTGPAYDTKIKEESEMLTDLMKADPALINVYGDLFFEKLGYNDLAERAKMLLPPPIQQALAAQEQGKDPVGAAQNQAMQAQIAQLQAMIQKLMADRQGKVISAQASIAGKTIDSQNRLEVQKLKNMGDIIVQSDKHKHDSAKHMLSEHTDAVEHQLDLLHEAELAPARPGEPGYVDPNAQLQENASQ